jgi:hypothetical protein
MRFDLHRQPEGGMVAIEETISQIERQALEGFLPPVVQISHPRNVVIGSQGPNLEAKTRQWHKLERKTLK